MWTELDYDEQRQFLYRDKYQHQRDALEDRGMRRIVKGAVAGMAGGLAAAAVMNLFQQAMSAATSAVASNKPPDEHGAQSEQPAPEREEEDATMKAAEAISETVAGHTLTKEQKKIGGTLIHYALGGSMGALYGALAEMAPQTTMGRGTTFGAAVWLGADEIGVPALGLSKAPTDYPPSTHAQALAAHLVYGLTTDTVRRFVRRAL